MKENYEAFVFDLDGTLAESKSALTSEMSEFLCKLLSDGKSVGVMSGGWMLQFEKQFLAGFDCDKSKWNKLYLMPTSGSIMYRWKNDEWVKQYEHAISEEDFNRIMEAFDRVLGEVSFKRPEAKWGEQIENRITQITFSALGQEAPVDEKRLWDKDHLKKQEIVKLLTPLLPEYSVRAGGTTSVDITKKGVDKQFGMEEFFKASGHTKDDTLFTGDALYEGGNDAAAAKTGVDTCQVDGPEDTLNKLRKYVK